MAWYGVIEELHDLENEEREEAERETVKKEAVGKEALERHKEMVRESALLEAKKKKDHEQIMEERKKISELRSLTKNIRAETEMLIEGYDIQLANKLVSENKLVKSLEMGRQKIEKYGTQYLREYYYRTVIVPILYKALRSNDVDVIQSLKYLLVVDRYGIENLEDVFVYATTDMEIGIDAFTALVKDNFRLEPEQMQEVVFKISLEENDWRETVDKLQLLLTYVATDSYASNASDLVNCIDREKIQMFGILLPLCSFNNRSYYSYTYVLEKAARYSMRAVELLLHHKYADDSFFTAEGRSLSFVRGLMFSTPIGNPPPDNHYYDAAMRVVEDKRFPKDQLYEAASYAANPRADVAGSNDAFVRILKILLAEDIEETWELTELLKLACRHDFSEAVELLLQNKDARDWFVARWNSGERRFTGMEKVVQRMKNTEWGFRLVAAQNQKQPSVFSNVPQRALDNMVDFLTVGDGQKVALKEFVRNPVIIKKKIGADVRARIKQM